MSIVPSMRMRKPIVAKRKRPIGNAVFKEIVKMAYEMGKADEQEQASKIFTSLMRYAFGVAIESDWCINPSTVLSDIFFEGNRGELWDAEKCELLFRYFVWKQGIKEFRKVLKQIHFHPESDHLVYIYQGQTYCKIDMCYEMLNRYVSNKIVEKGSTMP